MSDPNDETEGFFDDPLGSMSWESRGSAKHIAPIFCDLFGRNIYMVRKYLRFDYPIDSHRTLATAEWLFGPDGPSEQGDLVSLHREIGETDYLRPYFGHYPTLHTMARVERVLAWLQKTCHPRVFRHWQLSGDLTAADDAVVEGITAFLIASCAGIPSSEVEFVKPRNNSKTAEFRIANLAATVEVKHLLKVPQGSSEQRWLDAFKGQRQPERKAALRPEDEIAGKLHEGLEKGEGTARAFTADEIPWQKSTKSIEDTIGQADQQLASSPKSDSKVIVLYSDDPHTLTRDEDAPDQAEPSENRIEKALSSVRLTHADSVVLIANPFGFPIASGHLWTAYPKDKIQGTVSRMFGCLKPLFTADIRPAAIGLRVDLGPGESRTIRMSLSDRSGEEPPAGSFPK